MSVVDDIKTKTREQSVAAIEEKVAVQLKKAWTMLRTAAGEKGRELPADPTANLTFPPGATDEQKEELRNQEWMRISRELIDTGNLRFGGKDVVSLDEINGNLSDEMKQMMGVDNLRKLVPNRAQVNMIADTMADSVGKNSGTGIGFLDNLFGGASLGDVFMGLISWIFSGFEGGFAGLKTSIANNTGARLQSGVVQDLTALRERNLGTPNDISGFMTPDVINQVGQEVGRAPAQSLNPGSAPKPGASISAAGLGSIVDDLRGKAKDTIKQQFSASIDKGFRESAQFNAVYTMQPGMFTSGTAVARQEGLKKVRDRVSERLATVITDANYTYQGSDRALANLKGKKLSQMDADARALVLADEARQTILALREEDKAKGKEVTDMYALLAETMPREVQATAKQEAARINMIVSSGFSEAELIKPEARGLSADPAMRAAAADALKTKLAEDMYNMLYPGGSPSPDAEKINQLVGGTLERKHIDAAAGALAPVMLDLSAPDKRRELEGKLKGSDPAQQKAAMDEITSRFETALKDPAVRAKLGEGLNINDDTIKLLSMRMAQTYVAEELKAPVPAQFLTEMQGLEAGAARGFVERELEGQLNAKKGELESLIDPSVRPAPAGGKATLSAEEMTRLRGAVAQAVVASMADPNAFKDIIDNKDKYIALHNSVSDGIFAQLGAANPPLPFSEAGRRAMADEMAMQVLNKQGKVPDEKVPAEVRQRLATSRAAAANDVVGKSMAAELSRPDVAGLARAANGGRDVNMQVAADAAKGLLAPVLSDPARAAEVAGKPEKYTELVNNVRASLEAKRAEMGVAAGKDGDALLDIMAVKMVQGGMEKVRPGTAMPAPVQEMQRKAEGQLAEKMVPSMVRDMLMPKLTGTVSATDGRKVAGSSNLIIANLIALDSSRSGMRSNAEMTRAGNEKLVSNISNVVLNYQMAAAQNGGKVDQAALERHIRGALSDPDAKLGQQSIDALVPVLTAQIKQKIENPNAPTPAVDEAKMAQDMLASFKAQVRSDVARGMREEGSASGERIQHASGFAADAMERIVKGEENENGTMFVDMDEATRRARVYNHVHYSVENGLKPYFTFGKRATADGLAGSIAGSVVPGWEGGARNNRWDPSYHTTPDYDAKRPGDDKGHPSRTLQWRRREEHNQALADIENFRRMETELNGRKPSVIAAREAAERARLAPMTETNERLGVTGDTSNRTLAADTPAYLDAARAYMDAERAGLGLPATATPEQKQAAATRMNGTLDALLGLREAELVRVENVAKTEIGSAQAAQQQVVLSNREGLRLQDYIDNADKMADGAQKTAALEMRRLNEQLGSIEANTAQRREALEEDMGIRAAEARARIAEIKDSTAPADVAERVRLSGLVETYRLQVAQIDQEDAQQRRAVFEAQRGQLVNLPDRLEAADPAIKLAVQQRNAELLEKPTEESRAEFRRKLEGELAVYASAFRGRGPIGVFEQVDASRKDAGLSEEQKGRPMEGTRALAAPAIPENLNQKIAFAYAGMSPEAAQREVRRIFPQVNMLMQGAPLPANVRAADDKRSLTVKKFLEFIDRTTIVVPTEGADAGKKKMFYDYELPGYAAPDGSLRNVPQQIFLQQAFDTENRRFDNGRTVRDLTETGKKDVVELAVALRQRMDAPGISQEEKDRYSGYLESLRTTARQIGTDGKNRLGVDMNWKAVSEVIGNDTLLASMAREGLGTSTTAGVSTTAPSVAMGAGLNPLAWLATMTDVAANAGPDSGVTQNNNRPDGTGRGARA